MKLITGMELISGEETNNEPECNNDGGFCSTCSACTPLGDPAKRNGKSSLKAQIGTT